MKKLLFIITFLFPAMALLAQDGEEEPAARGFQRDKLFIGGNFGLSFGTYTFVNVSPQLGYRFTDHFAAGAGVNFQYISIKDEYTDGSPFRKTSQGVAGLNIFGRVYPVQFIMLQAQPEANYVFGKVKYYNPEQELTIDPEIVPSLLAGGGLVIPSGRRGAMIISVFYDVLQRPNSPYSNRPVYNFTFNVGL